MFVQKILATAEIIAFAVAGMATPATAKGPESITIDGSGIDGPIELRDTLDTAQLTLPMEQSGVWYATGDLPIALGEKPAGEFGPSYSLTWVTGSPSDAPIEDRTIRQLIFPRAPNGPIIYAQEVPVDWGGGVVGWYAASDGFSETMTVLGIPLHEPSLGKTNWNSPSIALLAAAAIGTLVWRRKRPTPIQASGRPSRGTARP